MFSCPVNKLVIRNFKMSKFLRQPRSQIETLWILFSNWRRCCLLILPEKQFDLLEDAKFCLVKSPICKQITLDILKKNTQKWQLWLFYSASFSFKKFKLDYLRTGLKKNHEIKARKFYLTENLSLTNDENS